MRTIRKQSTAGQALRVAIKDLGRVKGRVGWFESAQYPDGTPAAYVATIHEFGYGPIPPRLGMRQMQQQKQPAWREVASTVARKVTRGDLTAEGAMQLITNNAAGDMRKQIASVNSPPLSQVTLLLREYKRDNPGAPIGAKLVGEMAAKVAAGERSSLSGSAAKPLNDSGYLLATLTEIVDS